MASEDGQLIYREAELLSDEAYASPLFAGGVRCHGGFDKDGNYCSPRTLHRNPAVLAWQRQLARDGHPLIEIDQALVPPQYPSIEQARLLLKHGVREPLVNALTVIAIVEGFGAVIRDLPVPDLEKLFVEPISGTTLQHLDRGLFEAHARDEAGYGDQGGHKQMWDAARDLALENPTIPSDLLARVMDERARRRPEPPLFPELDDALYRMLGMMSHVYIVEVFAMSTFEWSARLLSDPEVSAAPKEAGAMVDYIRADEAPHVEYLRTALSEARARTIRTRDGGTIAGRTVVDGLLHVLLKRAIESRPREQRDATRGAVLAAHKAQIVSSTFLDEFDALEPRWNAPARTGFEPKGSAWPS